MIIALNKPYGVLSQFNKNPDYPEQKTLTDLNLPPAVMPLGRLDMDSEGLLLLSDEKELEDRLFDPKRRHKRCYLAQVDGKPDQASIEMLRGGDVVIRNYRTRKCWVRLLKFAPEVGEREPAVDPVAAGRSSWLEMELTEGKNRQVRRMTAKVGCPTLRLIRKRIGAFEPTDLASGEWRVISDAERDLLFGEK